MRQAAIQESSRRRASAALLVAALALGAVALAACTTPSRIVASGHTGSENRDVEAFTSVEIRLPGVVKLASSEAASVRITADRAALHYIRTEVADGVLTISVTSGGRPIPVDEDVPIEIEVRGPEILGVRNMENATVTAEMVDSDTFQIGNYGAGDVVLERINVVRLGCDMSGSGNVVLTNGAAGALQAAMDGSGALVAADLESQVAVINLRGSGDAEIWVVEALDATVSGSGWIRYWGEPELSAEAANSSKVQSLGFKSSPSM